MAKTDMLTVEEALNKVLSNTKVLEAETRPLLECRGQVLAEDVIADIDIPTLDNSAMDGFAVRAEDTSGASSQSPRTLKVIDTVIAGAISSHSVTGGTAIRIMTGAPVPSGADSVVPFEDTDKQDRKADEVAIFRAAPKGNHIRRTGDDVRKGSLAVSRGTILNPAHLGLLASVGKSHLKVIRRPRVAVLVTGNELVETGCPLSPGKLYNSNSYTIASLVTRYGGIPEVLGIARDSEDSLGPLMHQGLQADMLITTGGVSMGDFDLVKDIVEKEGRVIFWKVRLKPGKPVLFSIFSVGNREVPHLGLPGNQGSSTVTFEVFARPAILKMSGKTNFEKRMIQAISEDTLKNDDGRRVYARVVVERRSDRYFARTSGHQGSSILTSMSLANGLAVVPEDKPLVKPGDTVDVMMLDWGGEDL
ncbi:MAG: molybdopterin molybdotransferase MoeA [Dehalococcoidales bacterium]|nr:molybdopterin molybdotransferase MoeA [Dehalococcoidales bacterium]